MLNEKKLREIKEYEEAGLDVVVVNDGKVEYATRGIGSSEYCDQCSSFCLLPDPDPHDWFRDGDMKAVCRELNLVVEGSLERPSEWTNIQKPLYCPKLGRKLSEEEKKTADIMLELAKERTRLKQV